MIELASARPLAGPLARLNDAQRRAALHGIDGDVDPKEAPPLLVIAGAGSGKTATLAARVAALVQAGADPSRILVLTFSRRAAVDMERRVGRALHELLAMPASAAPPRLPWAGTFHSVGARLLRLHAARLGLDPSFGVDDRSDSEDSIHLLRHRLGLAAGTKRFPQKGTCASILSRCVNTGLPLADVLHDRFPWCADRHDDLQRLFAAYAEEKAGQHVLDLDDLLAAWAEAMAAPGVGREIASRFDHVLVDEYQDTNRLQERIVLALRPDGRGLTVVGDDAQAIYSFRGADVRNILEFADRFVPRANVVTLEQNYRSTPAILEASNRLIAAAAARHVKRMWSERTGGEQPAIVHVEGEAEEAAWVADRILALRESGLALKQQAVLFRSAQHSHALELELARRDIPFVKYGGLRFLEASHVKDVLAVLRFAANPRGQRAALRALQLVPGIGVVQAGRLMDEIAAAADAAAAVLAFEPSPAAREEWASFAALYASLSGPEPTWPDSLAAIERWYVPRLERLHDDAAARAADVGQLVHLARGYASRDRFLTELVLDPPAATSDESAAPSRDDDYLVLSTIHSAKGQQWRAVTVLRSVDDCIPSDMATGSADEIEEERRLLYVAMTRAREHLHLVVPGRFYVTQQAARGDRYVYASMSRFLTKEVRQAFDELCAGSEAPAKPARPDARAPDEEKARGDAVFDVAARLRSRWL